MTESKGKNTNTIDSANALAMWNAGSTLDELAEQFHCSRFAVRWAIQRGEKQGLGIARRGRSHVREQIEPPMARLWSAL